VTLLGVVAAANEMLNTNIEPVYTRGRADDFQPQSVSIVKAEAELGFCARIGLKQGLQSLIDYYTRQSEHVRADAPVDHDMDSRHTLNKKRAPPP
jgi:nucleoside-diphosphate-sugar epimerase